MSYTSPVLSWTGALAPGGTATITYTITVNNPDTGDKHLINTVTSASRAHLPARRHQPRVHRHRHDLIPALTITSTATPATATPGGTVTYTLTVADTGQTPYTGATFTDPLAGVLDDAAYNGDATAAATGTGTGTYLHRPGADLDREPEPRRHRHHHVLRHGEQPGYR